MAHLSRMEPLKSRAQIIMPLALSTNVNDEEPGEDGGPSDVMRQIGFGNLLSNQVSNQGKEVQKISNTTILVQDSSSVSTLVKNPILDLPGIEFPRSASVDVTTPEHSSSRTEFDSNPFRPRFDLEEEIVSTGTVNESTVGLPERPAVTKRKKMEEWKRNKHGMSIRKNAGLDKGTTDKSNSVQVTSDGPSTQGDDNQSNEEEYKDHERAKKEARDEKEADKVRADKGECNVYTVDLQNKTVANALLNLAMRTTFLIEQKYLEKGHTQMEADSVHAAIERRLRNREIHHPHDYLTVTREAKCLNHEFFRSYEIPEEQAYSSIRPGNFKNDPIVNNIVRLTYKPEGIFFKLQFSSTLQKLPQRKKLTLLNIVYPGLYSSQFKLSYIKWQHLQELKRVLPQHFHQFYDDLPTMARLTSQSLGRGTLNYVSTQTSPKPSSGNTPESYSGHSQPLSKRPISPLRLLKPIRE
uniref:Uncharacterized protein n=1 Tax=Timema bartmani TaxID=61472 RepID=A0A7R9I4F3_9NEOP|nr:unnamed protein product [Timema bartmani]